MTLVANDFQQGIKEVRERVPGLIGKRITGDKDHMFTGCWDGPQRVSGVIKYPKVSLTQDCPGVVRREKRKGERDRCVKA